MNGKKLEFKVEEALRELERLTINAREVQETILIDILSRNRETEYFRKHMKGAKDISEFKARVPIVTYKHILPYIERISNGEDSSIISGHPIVELLRSSGTTGGEPRLMPSITEDLDRRTYVYNLLMPIMSKYLSGLDKGKAMHLLFIKAETVLPSGIPARSVLTSYYKSDHFRCRGADPYNDLTTPNEVILCADSRQSMYCQLLSGLIHRHSVLRLGAVFASALLRSITFLEQNWLEFTNDIRLGKLNPAITDHACRTAMSHMLCSPNSTLADEIESICSEASWQGILIRLWPNVKCIEAVLTGTMAQYIPMLEFYSGGETPLVCTMYASSESYFGVNLNPLCHPNDVSYTLLPNMAYFEFIELENGLRCGDEEEVQKEKVVNLVDVKVGRYYEIVVTTFSAFHKLSLGNPGLYRYRVGDVLQATGFYNNAPQFKFIGRRNVVLSIDSDKTNEEDLHKSITAAKTILKEQNYLLIEYTSYADSSSVTGHYVLFWEIKLMPERSEPSNMQCLVNPQLIESCCITIEESLDYVYRRCRTHDRSVGPLEIRVVECGTFEALMDLLISQGNSINQYKTPRCIEQGPALGLLNSKVIGCYFSPKDPTWSA